VIFPLGFFILLNILKEAMLEIMRKKNDFEINSKSNLKVIQKLAFIVKLTI
jgi:hypothetical protein